jgi:hypothetical protein
VISSETSPLARSTRVDDGHRLDPENVFGRYSTSDADLRELGFEGDLNFADCAATLLPWREAAEAVSIVFAGPAAGGDPSTRLGAALGTGNRCAPTSALDRRLARRRQCAVRQRHLRISTTPSSTRCRPKCRAGAGGGNSFDRLGRHPSA